MKSDIKLSAKNKDQIRIFIADDEFLIRLDMKEELDREGFKVIGEAKDGVEALSEIIRLKPDVSIIDIMMPHMDGLKLAKRLKDEDLGAVVFLTAYNNKDFIDRASKIGAFSYLLKPYRISELKSAILLAFERYKDNKILREKNIELEESIKTKNSLYRAKLFIIEQTRLSENEIHKRMQEYSMKNRISLRELSDLILKTKNIPEGIKNP
ncbi:response regulator receiver and ANTAR domain protein [Thermodesulfobium acidiphilum]|uniref:Response regulator receiver and ANTAR domain protein n=1 Tax=Thermodesulfobium acidiphilum TaxID=1794699 RepID=A0A2R4W0C6_THEAF|nr:response regulator [Thermodesulfobium acidiphilum]AWB10257.1 response regulator receiver and ANTAR domain protein [Thermodesulfobium acidiphilum]PMP84613.1 MAG: response regulator [Thermodesulfobium narugense]